MSTAEVRASHLIGYTIESGVIRSLGKFEGETVYAPYFYENAEDGEILSYDDEGSEFAALIEITAEDREIWPEINADSAFIGLSETDLGFVSVRELTSNEANDVREAYEADNEPERDGMGA